MNSGEVDASAIVSSSALTSHHQTGEMGSKAQAIASLRPHRVRTAVASGDRRLRNVLHDTRRVSLVDESQVARSTTLFKLRVLRLSVDP